MLLVELLEPGAWIVLSLTVIELLTFLNSKFTSLAFVELVLIFVQPLVLSKLEFSTGNLYSLLKDSLGKSYPHLKVMIAFYLSSTHQTRVPQSLSKRNFGKRAYTPPVIFLFSDKRDEKSFMSKKIFSLPKISAKYKVEAYYCEEKEDVVYRTIFMLN